MGNKPSVATGINAKDAKDKDDGTPKTIQKIKSLSQAAKRDIDPRIAEYLVQRLQAKDREKFFTRIILKLPSIGDKFLKLQKAFEKFDSNSDGVIDMEELGEALTVLGAKISDVQVRSIFKVIFVAAIGLSDTGNLAHFHCWNS